MSGQIRGAKEAALPALGLGRMDSCIKDPQQELLQTYKEGNLRWILTSISVQGSKFSCQGVRGSS